MPRGPRLDLPRALHQVVVRGADADIFLDDKDRDDFLARVGQLAEAECWSVYAWALVPTHAQLVVRSGSLPLARCMRRLLTGYAGAFNRRYSRHGRLFADRYKSVVLEEERYLLELVRYIHLGPIRHGVVRDLAGLRRYPYTGHAALMGQAAHGWQETAGILSSFSPDPDEARRRYEAFVAEGLGQGRRPELEGGGLLRSMGGWAAVKSLRRAGRGYAADERVLGASDFVQRLRAEKARQSTAELDAARRHAAITVDDLIKRVAELFRVGETEIATPSRARPVSRARQLLAYLWIERLGRRASDLALRIGRTRGNVCWAAKRGAALASAHDGEIARWWS